MKFNLSTAEVFVPDGLPTNMALARTTHLAIGAHADDLEIMAAEPVLTCFQRNDKWFTGVLVTDGRGSPREDLYKHYTDEEMRAVRRKEQKKAAVVGEYAAQILLDYPSKVVKKDADKLLIHDIQIILRAAQAERVYTHNLADKHDTHVAVALKVLEAIRGLPKRERPNRLYGCEAWRGLDWMSDSDKVLFDNSSHENLQHALVGVFDSQICGGKRYDLATMGRRRSNATYFTSHETDGATGLSYAMDLTPLAHDDSMDVNAYIQRYIRRFSEEVAERLKKLSHSVS